MTRRSIGLALCLTLAIATASPIALRARAETCPSPSVKQLDRPEKYVDLFCVDADEKDSDFMTVVDVDVDGSTFGTITDTLDPGTKGNETHHRVDTDGRARVRAGRLRSSRTRPIDRAGHRLEIDNLEWPRSQVVARDVRTLLAEGAASP